MEGGMNLSNLYSPETLKHGLCTVVVVALLSYILPAVLPKDENPENMLNKINEVFQSVQSNPVPVLVVVFVGCIVGSMLCSSDAGVLPGQ